MRLESCKHFDTEMLMRNLKKWRKEKQKYIQRLDAMSELPSLNNATGIRSSEPSDPTPKLAHTRVEIEAEIKDIEACEEAYLYGLKTLSEEEKRLLEVFVNPSKPIWREIEDYAESNYMSVRSAYRMRRKIIDKMNRTIEEKFFL